MRKTAMSLAVIMVLLLPMTAYAATSRSIGIVPRISFSGTTANCSVIITTNSGNDEIEATITVDAIVNGVAQPQVSVSATCK